MKFGYVKFLVISLALMGQPASAGCFIKNEIETTMTSRIIDVKNVRESISAITGRYHECIVQMDVLIDGKWRKTLGSTIIREDEKQESACIRATEIAKERANTMYAPSTVKSKSKMHCDSRGGEYRKIDTFANKLPWLNN